MNAILERDFLSFARTKKFFVLRSLVVALPLVIFLLAMIDDPREDQLGQMIFWMTLVCQTAFFFFVTPAMLAHVLAEERKSNKLDVLRSSPISVTMITMSKWASRVGLIASMVVAGIPMMAFALIFGGVTTEHLLRAVALIFATVLWTSGVALWISASSRDVGRAVRFTFGTCVSIVMMIGAADAMMDMYVSNTGTTLSTFERWVMSALIVLDPFRAFASLEALGRGGVGFGPGGGLIINQPYLHLAVAAGFAAIAIVFSIRSLKRDPSGRSAAVNPAQKALDAAEAAGPLNAEENSIRARSAVALVKEPSSMLWARPMVWLELGKNIRPKKWRIVLPLLGLLFLEFGWHWGYLEDVRRRRSFGGNTTEWHMLAYMILFGLGIIRVAAAGSSVFWKDDESKTQEVLFASPLSAGQLLGAKVTAVLRTMTPVILLMLYHAILPNFLEPADRFVAHVGATMIATTILCAVAALAMWNGLRSTSIVRANVRTFSILLGLLLVVPAIVGLMLATSRANDGLGFFLLGWYPFMQVSVPVIEAAQGRPELIDQDGFFFVPIWFIGYVLFAWKMFFNRLPEIYTLKREDRTQ